MLKIILQDPRGLVPFNERARDLRVMNRPLWLSQRMALAPYVDREVELPSGAPLPETKEPCLVHRDNLYFDSEYIKAFMSEAMRTNRPCRAAFTKDDPAFREHALPLSTSYTPLGDLYMADLWYYPRGPQEEAQPLVVDLRSIEAGYYHVPTYMAHEQGDLVFQVPKRSLIAIDSWVHIFIADLVFGLFARAARFEDRLKKDPLYTLRMVAAAMFEGRQVLESSGVVSVGENCAIDPRAVIHGPTSIGNNVSISAGAIIENCVIGDNVVISQDCQLMLCVVGDGVFLPFKSSLVWTTIMENSTVAQNTCLQMCVIGRDSYIGAGSTFTDYNLLPSPLKAIDGNRKLSVANRPVLGGCVGHHCRIGAGMIIFPGRTIESDVVLISSDQRRVVERDVRFEDSDHHIVHLKKSHPRLFPRLDLPADPR
ncbi:MAG: multidrug transporter [Chloroflexota bacterium]|nr:MAG: multidrug transporter [Chloroflexota bacterium]